MRKHTLKEWVTAVRPWSFPASAMPVAVTLAYLYWEGHAVDWANGAWALANIIVFHAAGNTWSDYSDFRRGVDRSDTYGVRTLTGGMFSPSDIMRLSLTLLAVAVAGGIGLMLRTGTPLLYIGAAGAACTLLYPTLKYHALGDATIFATYALLPMIGTSYVATGTIEWGTMWAAIPVGLITVAILHANNTRDVSTDVRAGISTLAMTIGARASVAVYCAEILLPFVWVAVCVAAGIFPIWTLAVLAALVPAADNVRTMYSYCGGGTQLIARLDELTARLQLVFSLLLALSFLVAGALR